MGIVKWFVDWLDGKDLAGDNRGQQYSKAERNRAEQYLVAVAKEVEQVMSAEMFTPPGGPTYIPRNYLIFISPADDAEWRGEKRRGLEQGLFHVLSEHAAAMVGKQQQLQASSFAVELRVDETLAAGQFRVQPVWDTEAEKTIVKQRDRSKPLPPPLPVDDDDDVTQVRPRTLFCVLVQKQGETESERHNFSKSTITIGRGSRTLKPDLTLAGDKEISREHALIEYQQGQFKITCKGKNPIKIGNDELLPEASTTVAPGQQIEICSYQLELQQPTRPLNQQLQVQETSTPR